MRSEKPFIFMLFTVGTVAALFAERIPMETSHFVLALLLFWLFSTLYHHLSVTMKQGGTTVDYGISYGLAVALFIGPFGLLIYQLLYRFTVYAMRKWRKTEQPKEFLHTFYNVGAFTLANTTVYYLFLSLKPYFAEVNFMGFWLLIFLLVIVSSYLTDTFLLTVFYLMKEITTVKGAWEFYMERSLLDVAKTALTNGLLYVFLIQEQWEFLFGLFLLNYLVSRSFAAKSQHMQDKLERDKFKEMAYTDFLTGINNRAAMDKKMQDLSERGEVLGVAVVDIDRFKVINDTYNHSVGDQVLRHFAGWLKGYLREEDGLFRSGGEEFTIFLRNRPYEEVYALIERIKIDLEKSFVEVEFNGAKKKITYTASFGLYYKYFFGPSSVEKGYIYADNLLFQSKRLGRNRLSAENGTVCSVEPEEALKPEVVY